MVKKSYKGYEESWRSMENCKEWGDWCELGEELWRMVPYEEYRITNYELWVMNYELRIMNYDLWIKNYKLYLTRTYKELGIMKNYEVDNY